MNDLLISNQLMQCFEDLRLAHKKARSKFTHEEDLKLIQLVENSGKEDWVSISKQMPGRNPRQCRDRWTNYLSPNVVNGPWTNEEEELLMEKFKEFGPSWKCIAKFFPTRTAINVKSRFNLIQRRIKKEELKIQRNNLDKKLGQKRSSNFANLLYDRCFHDETQNLQFCPQRKRAKRNNLNNKKNSANQENKNVDLPNSLAINSSPLPLISFVNTKSERNKENTKSSTNDIINMVFLDLENDEFDIFNNIWF